MKPERQRHKTSRTRQLRQINLRVDGPLYEGLETLAQEEQRSVAQVARRLVNEGLAQRLNGRTTRDAIPAPTLAEIAASGEAFKWLAAEPDLYDDSSGEPL